MERATAVPDSSAQPGDPGRVNDYDSFAEAYAAENENNLVNAYYERPAMLALAGDVAAAGSWTQAAVRAPSPPHFATAVPPSPASTPAPECWPWPGGGSVTT